MCGRPTGAAQTNEFAPLCFRLFREISQEGADSPINLREFTLHLAGLGFFGGRSFILFLSALERRRGRTVEMPFQACSQLITLRHQHTISGTNVETGFCFGGRIYDADHWMTVG
jgi:hypothetical protein